MKQFLIGHPGTDTIGAALPADPGRRIRLVPPEGFEKRVAGDLDGIAAKMNRPGTEGSGSGRSSGR